MTFKDILGSLKKAKDSTVSYLDRDKAQAGFQFTKPKSFVREGVQRVQKSFKEDPGQYWIGRGVATQVPTTQKLFKPLIGEKRAEQLAYGIRGASQLTPFTAVGGEKTRSLFKKTAPVTERQKQAQSVGRSLYGYGLTAPIGGGSKILQTAGRMATSTGAGALLGGGINRLMGGDFKTGAKRGAYQGFKQGPLLAITNPLTSKAVGAVAPGLGFVGSQVAKRSIGAGANLIEDEILAKVDGLPLDKKDRIQSLVLGAVMTGNDEAFKKLGTQLMQIGVPINRIKPLVDTVRAKGVDVKRKLSIPVKTLEQDPKTGEFITRPMWQVMLQNQQGGVGARSDLLQGKVKPGDIVDPKTGNVSDIQTPKASIFGDVGTKENEMLLRLMEQRKPEGFEGVVADLKSVLEKRKPDIEQPGYLKSLTDLPERATIKAPEVPRIEPTTSLGETDISSTLKRYKQSGLPEVRTQEQWNQSVIANTTQLKSKHTNLRSVLEQVDAENGKEHLADIIQKGVSPKSPLYAQARDLYKNWAEDLAGIEGLTSIGKTRRNYHASFSNEKIFGDQIREMAGGTPNSLFDLPHLKGKTNIDFIGDSSLVDTFDYRTKGAVLNAHSGANIDISPQSKIIRDFQTHVGKYVDQGGDYKPYDLIGDFQKSYAGPEKLITAKTFSIGDKATHTFDMVMQKIAKGGGEELNASYQKIREADIFIKTIKEKFKGAELNQKIGVLNKMGMQVDEGLVKYLTDKKGMTEENIIDMLLNQKLKREAIGNFVEKAGEYKFQNSNVKDIVNDFANGLTMQEISKSSLLDKITRQTISTVVTAHLGLNPVTAAKQLLEITRVPVYAGFKNTAVGTLRALNAFDQKSTKYGLGEFDSNYTPKDIGLLKGGIDKVKDAMFIPMQKMELFKNRVFALSMEEALKNKDMTEVAKLHKIRDVLFGGGNVAHKFNKPLLLKSGVHKPSTLGDALGLYFQFSIKNFDIKANEIQHKEYKKFGQLLAADLTSAALTTVLFGYPISWALENLLPVGSPVLVEVFTKLYDGFKQYGEAMQSGKENDIKKAKYYLNRSLVQNIVPAGVQGVRMYEAGKIMEQGADISPTGYERYEAPTDPMEQAKMFTFGKSSTKAHQEYIKELEKSDYQRPKTKGGLEGLKFAIEGVKGLVTQKVASDVSAAEEIPTVEQFKGMDQESFNDIYKKANRTAKDWKKDKSLIDNDPTLSASEKEEKLSKLKEKKVKWGEQLIKMEREAPEKVFDAQISSYKSGSGALVEDRAKWAKEQIEKASKDEKTELIQKLIDEKVLTTGTRGVIAKLKEMGIDVDDYDVNVLGTGNVKIGKVPKVSRGTKLKFTAPKVVSAPSFAKVKLGSAKKAPNVKLPSVRIKPSDTSALSKSKKLTKGYKVKSIKPKLAKIRF